MKTDTSHKPKILLALQGGGAWGAFTWGVLDWLLEHDAVEIIGISGASAGATNGAALAYGGGNNKIARDTLKALWQGVIAGGKYGPFDHRYGANLPHAVWQQNWSNLWLDSPIEQWHPNGHNPLLAILQKAMPDAARFSAPQAPTLLISTLAAKSGEEVIFTGKALTHQTLAASACLPPLTPLVKINDEAHLDGGFISNPPLLPLLAECPNIDDVLVIRLNPSQHRDNPKTLAQVQQRFEQSLLNSALRQEMLAMQQQYPQKRLHQIAFEPPQHWDLSSKRNVNQAHIMDLYSRGRAAAAQWWAANGHTQIGRAHV